jgi:pimeloyl-ACP methyl ester carboxylesterase/DNA-binding winged helix-turn-helix (wHTH) protein
MIYAFDIYELDTGLYELRRAGERCSLEPQAFDLLAYLVEQRDRVVTKDELIGHLWPERFISEAALTTRVMEARKALGDSGHEQRYIATVRGRGYRFTGDVRTGRAEPAPAHEAAPPATPPLTPDEQEIRFCTTGDGVGIAYATTGAGPPFVKVANWLSHLEFDWRSPIWRHWIRELSRDHLLVRYDERGCGLSDLQPADFSFEGWLRDLEAVVDALGLERFPLLGISQGGPAAIAYAARHPERISHLVLYGTYGRGRKWRMTPQQKEERQALMTLTKHGWGRDDATYRQIFTMGFIPDATPEQMQWFNDLQRASAPPENAYRFMQEFDRINVEDLLPRLNAPALVLHAKGDARVPFEEGRRLAAGIAGARFVPLEGRNHILLESEPAWPAFLAEVRRFLGVEAVHA